jgi:hypothetical protein
MSRKWLLPMLLIGLGAGAVVGVFFGLGVVWWILGIGAVGVVLSFAGPRRTKTVPAPRGQDTADLGTNVERILRLAEEQAHQRRDDARREAERILAEAKTEAAAIRERAPATRSTPYPG